jgi:hypothetical protein
MSMLGTRCTSSSASSISPSVGAPKDRPFRRGLLHGAHGVGIGMAEDQRAPGTDVVEVGLAVGVPDARAFAAGKEARRAAHRTEGAHRGIDAAGNGFLGAGKEVFVAGHGRLLVSDSGKGGGAADPAPPHLGGEKLLVGLGARLDVHGIEQVADHGQHVGAGGDHLRRIVQRDAADGGDRQAEAPLRLRPAVPAARLPCRAWCARETCCRRRCSRRRRRRPLRPGRGRCSRKRRGCASIPGIARGQPSEPPGASSRPRWAPSAPISTASQTSSLMISLAPAARQMRSISAAWARRSGRGASLLRYCT